MKLHTGPVPTVEDFKPEESGWNRLKEPSPWMIQLAALPMGLLMGLLVTFLWIRVSSADTIMQVIETPLLKGAVIFVLLIPIHEIIHALAHPGLGFTSRTILGVWPKKFLFYAHYLEEISRNRLVLIMLMPFITLSLLPLALHAVCPLESRIMSLASVMNALVSCGDLVGVMIILSQLKSTAVLKNQGYRTWWRESGSDPA